MLKNKKTYAVVANFGFRPVPKGLLIYRYDLATGNLQLVETAFDEERLGHISFNAEQEVLYVTNECPNQRGQIGGGGYLMALKIDPESGKPRLINDKPSLSGEPCYTCLDKTNRYIVVSHHADMGFVTKVVKSEKGFSSQTVFDDTSLTLFRLNEDGSIGDICDVALTPGEGASGPHTTSRHHSVNADPTGELLIVCDKGLDKIHTFHLDRANEKLVYLQSSPVETGFVPRYGAFHPTLPIFYANFERKTVIRAYRYDVATGTLELLNSIASLDEKAAEGIENIEAADIVIHPSSKYLYTSVRGPNVIAVLDIDDAGGISLRENVDCGGQNPRGLCISPDRRFLFALNNDSSDIATFVIGDDGALRATGAVAKSRQPGNMKFITV